MTTATRKETPCLFNGDMIRALLKGKSQTRRIVKMDADQCFTTVTPTGFTRHPHSAASILRDIKSPLGQPGDLIWARETWGLLDTQPSDGPDRAVVGYRADCEHNAPNGRYQLWRPSIHMPKWAARIWLEITRVRVERVKDISEEDAIAEGAQCAGFPASLTNRGAFAKLWTSLYGAESWEWDWVWVYDFKRTERPVR